MNRMRKILSAVLALALILSFSGCNSAGKQLTPEEVIKTALQNLLNIKSVSYEFNVDTEFSVVGQTVATNTKTTADATLNPMNMKLNMVVSVGSYDATNLEMYALQEENGLTLYTCADGKNWMKQEGITADQIAQYNMMDAISLYLSTVSNLQDTGHEQIGDFDTVKYEGTLSSDAFSEVLKVSGMQEQLESLGVDADTAAGFYEELGELPITLWIHPSTFMPVSYTHLAGRCACVFSAGNGRGRRGRPHQRSGDRQAECGQIVAYQPDCRGRAQHCLQHCRHHPRRYRLDGGKRIRQIFIYRHGRPAP